MKPCDTQKEARTNQINGTARADNAVIVKSRTTDVAKRTYAIVANV